MKQADKSINYNYLLTPPVATATGELCGRSKVISVSGETAKCKNKHPQEENQNEHVNEQDVLVSLMFGQISGVHWLDEGRTTEENEEKKNSEGQVRNLTFIPELQECSSEEKKGLKHVKHKYGTI